MNVYNVGMLELTPIPTTVNVGCQLYLQSEAEVLVVHWLELLDKSCTEEGGSITQ